MERKLPPEQFEDRVKYAKIKCFNPEDQEPTDYSHPERVIEHVAETVLQLQIALAWEASEPDPKADKIEGLIRETKFFATLLGRLANLEGASSDASMYEGYDTEDGNQIDEFLTRIGYLKPPKHPDALKKEIIERAKYYIKGFGNHLRTLTEWIKMHSNNEGDKYKEKAEEFIDATEAMFDTFTLEDILDHPDFDLLSQIKIRIPKLAKEVRDLLSGEKQDLKKLETLREEIITEGEKFRKRLEKLIKEIRQYPGYERFHFATTDMEGRFWKAPVGEEVWWIPLEDLQKRKT
jgi:hypothetical protein